MTRDIDYILAGLDKLYTQSTSLTREQVDASSAKSEARLAKKVKDAKERGEKMKVKWSDQAKPFVREAMDSLGGVLGREWEDLKQKVGLLVVKSRHPADRKVDGLAGRCFDQGESPRSWYGAAALTSTGLGKVQHVEEL